MHDLLLDNIHLVRNMELLPGLIALPHPKLREVRSLHSWVTCFAAYVAIISKDHPERICSLMAYNMCLIICEARKNRGEGWLSYDAIFRQHAANDPSMEWSQLDSGHHSVTFLAFKSNMGKFCLHYYDSDHYTTE